MALAAIRHLVLIFLAMCLQLIQGNGKADAPTVHFHCEAADKQGNAIQVQQSLPVKEAEFTAFAAVQAAENVIFRLPRRYRGSGAKVRGRIGFKTAAQAFGADFAAGVAKQLGAR